MVIILTINNKLLSTFGISTVLTFNHTTSTYTNSGAYWNEGSLKALRGVKHETYRKLKSKFLFSGKSKIDLKKYISRFIEECKDCKFKDDNFYYDVELTSNSEPEFIGTTKAILSLDFDLLDLYENEKNITKNTNFNIDINSPKPCYANLELIATTNVISYTIKINNTEIIVKNIKGNETIYIGSGKVVANGNPKINDVEIWEFPKLQPGGNKIEVNRSDVNLTIRYCERW